MPRQFESNRYLLQLFLQQSAHLPSEHLAQELQPLVQQLLQASEAEAVVRPYPAMRASRAPALMRVVSVFICSCLFGAEGISRSMK